MKKRAKLFISLVYHIVGTIFRGLGRAVGYLPPARCVVLYYHSVGSEYRDRFAEQMDQLLDYATPIKAGHTGALERGRTYVVITFDDALHSVLDEAYPELKKRSIPFTIFIPSALMGSQPTWPMAADCPDAHEFIMTAEELAALPEDLVTLGSHTRVHPKMTELDEEEARSELEGSRNELEHALGRTIDLFAFPYGAHDEATLSYCRDAGYRRVFLVTPGVTQLAEEDYAIPRVAVEPSDGALDFRLKILGAYSWMPTASALKRTLMGRA